MPRLSSLLALALSAAAHAQFPGATAPPADLEAGYRAITVKDAKSVLTFLATECDGRGTGQPGFQKAADFVAKRFRAAGLKPLGDNGTYFQHSTFYAVQPGAAEMAAADGKPLVKTGLWLRPTGNVDRTASIALIRTSDANSKLSERYLDRLVGRLVLLDAPSGRSAIRGQLAAADTAGVLTIVDKDPGPFSFVSQSKPKDPGRSATVRGTIVRNSAKLLLPEEGQVLETSAPTAVELSMIELPVHLVSTISVKEVQVPNVVGMLEGSDPVLKNETIGIGGHLDHLGNQNGVVYPGADDDGSGSTAVMEIAKAMAANPKKPRRSLVFMTFFGEEMGLLGSSYLTEHPPVPLGKMVAELQMDMVGRDSYGAQNGDPHRMDVLAENRDTMRLVGSKRISTELNKVIQLQNASVGFKFKYDAEDVYTRSDHYNFAKHGIPIAFLFDGFTPDYHQPSDTVDKIDWLKLTNAAKLFYLTAHAIADRDEPLPKDVK